MFLAFLQVYMNLLLRWNFLPLAKQSAIRCLSNLFSTLSIMFSTLSYIYSTMSCIYTTTSKTDQTCMKLKSIYCIFVFPYDRTRYQSPAYINSVVHFFSFFTNAKIGIILVWLLYKFICFIYVSYGKINKVFTFAYYQLMVDNRSKIKIISYKE